MMPTASQCAMKSKSQKQSVQRLRVSQRVGASLGLFVPVTARSGELHWSVKLVDGEFFLFLNAPIHTGSIGCFGYFQ